MVYVFTVLNFTKILTNFQTKSSKSVVANNTHLTGVETNEYEPSSSTSSTHNSSLIPILKTRRSSRVNYSETRVSLDRDNHKLGAKQKHSSSEVEPSTSQESLANNSVRNTYRQKLRSPKSRKDNLNKRKEEDSRSRSSHKDHQEGNSRRKSDKNKNNSRLRSLSTSESSTSSLNIAVQQVKHKYPLRNRLPTVAYNNRVSAQECKTKESVALGASTSHQTTREEQEPSRLTRSGAVLRRSTRNSKGKP